MASTVKFDQTSSIALVPDLYLSGNTPPVHAIASHLTRRVRKLRPGKWFVQLTHDQRAGYIGFHASDDQIPFTIEAGAR